MDWTTTQLYMVDDGDGFPTGCEVTLNGQKGIAIVLFTSVDACKKYLWSYTNPANVTIRPLARKDMGDSRGVVQFDLILMIRTMAARYTGVKLHGALINPTISSIGTVVYLDDLTTHGAHSKRKAEQSVSEKDRVLSTLIGDD